MTKAIQFTLLFFLVCSTASSSNEGTNLKPYYFPYDEFHTPKIYKYVDQNNPDNIQYWLMEMRIVGSDTILVTKAYNAELKQIELFRERINSEGTTMIEFTMMDESKVTRTKPVDTEVYLWQQSKDDPITWSATYQSEYGEEQLAKTREFVSTTDSRVFKNTNHKTIKFKDTFTHSVKNSDWSDAYDYYQYSFYCQGLGMIEYERFLPNGNVIHYYLDKVLTEEQWNVMNVKK